jgi:NADP-dependent 3-hydroxy acid dehydrogenase YdfG
MPTPEVSGMLKENALKGKTIIVTGGGTGLGKAMGTYFLKLGANLVITSRKLDVLQKTADEMEAETGGKVLALTCDVRNYNEVENMLNKTIERFGSVNALLNNALFRQQKDYRPMHFQP